MSGKGDTPRPKSVSEEQYSANWDAIFGKGRPDTNGDVPNNPNEEVNHER